MQLARRGSGRLRKKLHLPDAASIAQGGLVLWLVSSALAVGWLVYLISIRSPQSIYRIASLPALLVVLIAVVAAFRIKDSHVPIAILLAAAFLPLSLPTGTASRLVDSLILTIVFTGVWLTKRLVMRQPLRLKSSPVNRPLVAFTAISVVSLGWGILVRDPLVHTWSTFTLVQLASTVVMIMLPAAFLLVANYVKDTRTIKTMVVLMLIAGVLGLPKQYEIIDLPINTDGLYTMWVVTLAAGLVLFHRKLEWWLRAGLGFLALIWVYWGFIEHIAWLAGWLPALFSLGIMVLIRSRKLFFLLSLIAVLFVLSRQSYYVNTVLPNEENESLYSRLDAWATNWGITKDHLLLGTGPAGYAAYYISYFPTEAMATHSNFVDMLSQTGVIGLGLLLWFFYELIRVGLGLRRRLRGRGDFAEALGVSLLAGTLGALLMMGFGDWVIPFAYTQTIAGFDHAVYTWLFMGTIISLDAITESEDQSRSDLYGTPMDVL